MTGDDGLDFPDRLTPHETGVLAAVGYMTTVALLTVFSPTPMWVAIVLGLGVACYSVAFATLYNRIQADPADATTETAEPTETDPLTDQ